MKKIAAGEFKVHCLAIMDEVQTKRESVVITKRGKPVAKLVPVDKNASDFYGFLAGKDRIAGDIVVPAFSWRNGGICSDSIGYARRHLDRHGPRQDLEAGKNRSG
jgi:prevent-host-death family protein